MGGRVYDGTRPCECRHETHGGAGARHAADVICTPVHFHQPGIPWPQLVFICWECRMGEHVKDGQTWTTAHNGGRSFVLGPQEVPA